MPPTKPPPTNSRPSITRELSFPEAADLFKAAEVQSNVLHTDEAVALYDRIINDYPDFEDLPICYFLKGIAYESDSQFEKARQAYQTFVDKYPDHYMADQTRKMIPLVGKSTEEMLDDILAAANDTIIAR